MGVYISGLEMPKDGRITLQIDSSGGVYVVNKFSIISEKYEKSMTATWIQPHGRLGDLDELKKKVLSWLPSDPCGQEEKEFPFETDICVSMLMEIEDADTIIEAERSEE
jgi:hypothetical protein